MIKSITKIAFLSYKTAKIGYLLLFPPLFVINPPPARMFNILYLRIICMLLQSVKDRVAGLLQKNCYLI